jgi:hypothetical protein
MAIQIMTLDPNAGAMTGDAIITAINAGSSAITRAACVSAAARPLAAGEAKTNLDAMTDLARGYVKTSPTTGKFKVIAIQRDAAGKLEASYDDVAV